MLPSIKALRIAEGFVVQEQCRVVVFTYVAP